MDHLSPRKLILAVLITSVASSFLVSVLTLSFLTGQEPDHVMQQILAQDASIEGLGEKILRQDEIVVSVVEEVSPAVVSVVATKDVPILEQYFIDPFEGNPFFEGFGRIPQFRERGTEEREISSGTGFIVSEDGLIVTNRHVVADENADYTVFFNDGSKTAAKVLGRDPVQDLAILKVEKTGLRMVQLGNSGDIAIGQSAIAIGNALGEFENTVSVGIVSGLHRNVRAVGSGGSPEELEELIQTDAAINPGNSGGPLLNLRGEVIGINTAMAQGAENIGFAIPVNKVKRDIDSVKIFGRIVYPFLGIRYLAVTRDLQEERNLPVDYGALVSSGDESSQAVVPGSPAAQAGLESGDLILEINGERINREQSLAAHLQKYSPGDTVTLKVLRGSQELTMSVKLEERT